MTSKLRIISIHPFKKTTSQKIPLFSSKIKAGFPSPADDFIEKKLDLNNFLVKHPLATFFVRVDGNSMINAGIHSGDILIVDRSLEPQNKNIIIAVLDGEMTVKRITIRNKKMYLCPENSSFKNIEIKEDMNFEIWGIVTNVIHQV